MSWVLILIAAEATGLGRRVAGGLCGDLFGWTPGDTAARAVFAATGAGAVLAGGAVWWMAAIGAVSVFAGATTGNLGAISMGRGATGFGRDFALLTVHGLAHAALLAAAMAAAGAGAWFAPLIGAALISPVYAVCWMLPSRLLTALGRGFGGGTRAQAFADPPQLAELLWGALFGLSLAVSGAV